VRAADDAAELYQLCAQCHGPGGESNRLAPAIAELAVVHQAQLTTSERRTHAFRGHRRAAHVSDVTDAQDRRGLDAIAAFVAALAPAPAPVLTGGDRRTAPVYQVCLACHGPDGAGNQAMGSPRLGGERWYLLTSLQKLKAGTRGTYPTAVIMRGMAGTLPDEQAMKDVIAHIMTLSSQAAAIAK
jgi:cytochrome c553